jgi:hypothetical protein
MLLTGTATLFGVRNIPGQAAIWPLLQTRLWFD